MWISGNSTSAADSWQPFAPNLEPPVSPSSSLAICFKSGGGKVQEREVHRAHWQDHAGTLATTWHPENYQGDWHLLISAMLGEKCWRPIVLETLFLWYSLLQVSKRRKPKKPILLKNGLATCAFRECPNWRNYSSSRIQRTMATKKLFCGRGASKEFSVESTSENLNLTQLSLAVVTRESGFQILWSKHKLVFSSLQHCENHNIQHAPANPNPWLVLR